MFKYLLSKLNVYSEKHTPSAVETPLPKTTPERAEPEPPIRVNDNPVDKDTASETIKTEIGITSDSNIVKKDIEKHPHIQPDYSDLISKYDIGYLVENAKIPDVGRILENYTKMYDGADTPKPTGIHYEQKVISERIAADIDPFVAPIHIRTYMY